MPESPVLAADLDRRASLEVDGVSIVTKRGTPVIDDVSLTVDAGEVLGLVGESGSGKTTFGLSLLGYVRRGLTIRSGRVRVGGVDVLELSQDELQALRGRRVSYVPQDPSSSLNPSRKVRVQLRESLQVHLRQLERINDIDARIAEVCAEARLPMTSDVLDVFPHQLSGGQQQRVALAMAFACRPELIVLDEPTTGLDVTTQRHVLSTIRDLTRTYGVAAVYVSHDLPVVAEVAARVAVMYAGRLVEIGEAEDVMRSPAHPYTMGLLRAAPSPERRLALIGIEGKPPRPGEWPAGCGFAPRCERVGPDCVAVVPALSPIGRGRMVRCLKPSAPLHPPGGAAGLEVSEAEGAHLEVLGLSARYGGGDVLQSVGFELTPGECLAVVGESGSGKTTLARCIVGMHSNWSGIIRLDGVDLPPGTMSRGRAERRRIQYIFQNPYTSLNPRKTVADNLATPLAHFEQLSRAARIHRIEEMLEHVALDRTFSHRYPDELSGGERQRVAIGRALIVSPDLVICDEVTSALDVSVQAVIITLLRRLQSERGISMLFITHNIAAVRSIAQQVLVMHRGRVVETGPVEEVLGKPANAYTEQLLRDVPRLSSATGSPVAEAHGASK